MLRRGSLTDVLSLKNNHVIVDYDIVALSATVSTHEARIDTAETDIFNLSNSTISLDGRLDLIEPKIAAGITASVTVMINPTPTYKTLNFTNGILTSVV